MSATFNGITYAAAPPDGVARDLNQHYEATPLIVICGITLPVAVMLVWTRLYVRYFITSSVGVDDVTMLGALVCSAVLTGFIAHMLQHGLGKNMWNVPLEPDFYPIWMLDDLLAQVFFVLATTLSRCSILLFYLRIFTTRDMKWAVWSSLTLVITTGVSCQFVILFTCNPVSAFWTLAEMPTATCINQPAFYYAQAGLFIVIDFLTVLVPVPKLKSLRMPTKQKVGVGVMLVIGSTACIVSIYRLHSISVIQSSHDLSRDTVPGLMWCVLEVNISIIGGSVPALKPFLQRHAPRLLSLSQSKYRSRNAHDDNITRSRSTFGRLEEGGGSTDWNTKSGATVSCSMFRSRKEDTPLSPITSNSIDELPLQGAIKKAVYNDYELEEGIGNGPSKRYEDRIWPISPAYMRDPETEAKVSQEGCRW